MKAVKNIRIRKEAVNELQRIEAVDNIELGNDGSIVVHLNPMFTNGRLRATSSQYLVLWENGMWQVYGSDAFNRLFKNPNNNEA